MFLFSKYLFICLFFEAKQSLIQRTCIFPFMFCTFLCFYSFVHCSHSFVKLILVNVDSLPLIYSNIFPVQGLSFNLVNGILLLQSVNLSDKQLCFFYLLESDFPDMFHQRYTKGKNEGGDLRQCRQLLIIFKFSKDSVTSPALSLQLSPPTFGE